MKDTAKKISPQNPASSARAETTEKASAERKTAGINHPRKTANAGCRFRRTARKTAGRNFP